MASEWRRKDPGDTLRFHCRNPHCCGRRPQKKWDPQKHEDPPKWEKRKCWQDRTLLLTGITLDDLLGCLGELCWFLHQRGESDNIWLQCWCNCGCSRVKSKYFHHLRITAGGKWCGSNAQICIPPITAHSSNLIFASLHPHRWFIPTSYILQGLSSSAIFTVKFWFSLKSKPSCDSVEGIADKNY